MSKRMRSYRLSWETRIKLRQLSLKLGKNETAVIEEAIEKLYKEMLSVGS